MFLCGYGIGVFTILFFIAWLDEREDIYSGIQCTQELQTCIEWSTRLQGIHPPKVYLVSMKNYRTEVYWYRKNVERITGCM